MQSYFLVFTQKLKNITKNMMIQIYWFFLFFSYNAEIEIYYAQAKNCAIVLFSWDAEDDTQKHQFEGYYGHTRKLSSHLPFAHTNFAKNLSSTFCPVMKLSTGEWKERL